MRLLPNIIITGVPGVGKTVHCTQLTDADTTNAAANGGLGLKHLPINQIVKERKCHDGFDEELQSLIVDEDKVSADAIRERFAMSSRRVSEEIGQAFV